MPSGRTKRRRSIPQPAQGGHHLVQGIADGPAQSQGTYGDAVNDVTQNPDILLHLVAKGAIQRGIQPCDSLTQGIEGRSHRRVQDHLEVVGQGAHLAIGNLRLALHHAAELLADDVLHGGQRLVDGALVGSRLVEDESFALEQLSRDSEVTQALESFTEVAGVDTAEDSSDLRNLRIESGRQVAGIAEVLRRVQAEGLQGERGILNRTELEGSFGRKVVKLLDLDLRPVSILEEDLEG
ncbi:hypothetical protein D3C87_1309090 [compost metagenome]